jgi:hypothetical protein
MKRYLIPTPTSWFFFQLNPKQGRNYSFIYCTHAVRIICYFNGDCVGILPIMWLPLSKKMAAMWESKRAAGAAFAAPWHCQRRRLQWWVVGGSTFVFLLESLVRHKTQVFWEIPEFSKLSKTSFDHSTV